MIKFVPKAAIFDFDDTILNNKHGVIGESLHELSRLAAVRFVGKELDIEALQAVTIQQNYDGFRYAKEHTVEGGVWNIMHMAGVVDTDEIDHTHPILRKIAQHKHELHENILLEQGEIFPDAYFFIRAMHRVTDGRLAIASTASRRDIDIVFDKSGLWEFFDENKVVSKEKLTKPKPDPQAFDMAFESLGLNDKERQKTVAFEDDVRGIASAKAAGLFIVALTSRYTAEQLQESAVPPNIITDSYTELIKIFNLELEV